MVVLVQFELVVELVVPVRPRGLPPRRPRVRPQFFHRARGPAMGHIGSRPRVVAPESQRLSLGELRGDCRLEPLSLAADGPEMGILGELGSTVGGN